MKKILFYFGMILTGLGYLDSTLSLTDRIKNTDLQMTISLIIRVVGLIAFLVLIIYFFWQGNDHAKKIKALKKFYEIKIEWLETNTQTHLLEAFYEIEKIGNSLVDAKVFKDFKLENDPKIEPIKTKFRSDINKALQEFNNAFQNWKEE
jgi:hypothetical protein